MTLTHRQSGTKLHFIWIEMRQRCDNPEHKRYPLYGSRGIRVCDEWQRFEAFYEWAHANGYQEGLSIDRIDNSGNYEPGNCRWATQREQCNNTRRSKLATYAGRTQTLSDWALELGLNYHTLRSRLRLGWPVDRAIETPMEGKTYAHRHSTREWKRRQLVHGQ